MKVVRDDKMNGILMIPLWDKYNLHRCNVRGCANKQTTIIIELLETPPFALCDDHYFKAKTDGKIECTLDFD